MLSFLLATLTLASGSSISAATVDESDTDEYYLLDLKSSGQMLAQNVPAYRQGDDFFVEFEEFLGAVEFPISFDGQSWSGWYRSQADQFDWVPTEPPPAPSEDVDEVDWLENSDGFFVPTEALEDWFELDIAVNDKHQTLTIESETPLPFEAWKIRRLTRYGHQSAENLPTDVVVRDQYHWATPPLINVSAGVRTGGSAGENLNVASSSVTMGLDLLKHSVTYAGSFAAGRYGGEDTSDGSHRLTLERARVTQDDTLIAGATSYSLGDIFQPVSNLVASGHMGRGAALIRSPNGQIGNLTLVNIVGDGQPGWEVELYRNGTLVDFGLVGRDGRFVFEDQELMFGENRFVTKLYGPQGQLRLDEQIFWGGGTSLERDDYDYSMSHVEFDTHFIDSTPENADTLPASYMTDLRASRAWTDDVQIGGSYSRVGLGNRRLDGSFTDEDYLSIFGRMKLGQGVLIGEGAQQLSEGGAVKIEYLTGRRGHNVRIAHHSFGDYESPSTLQTVKLDSMNEVSFIGGFDTRERFWNYSVMVQQRDKANDTSDFRLFNRIGSRFGRVNLTNEFELIAQPGQNKMTGQFRMAGRYRRVNFRGGLHYQFNGRGFPIRQISATMNWSRSEKVRNNLQFTQNFSESQGTFITNLTSIRIGNYDLTFNAGTNFKNSWQLGVGFNVSLGFDRARGNFVTDRRALAGTGRATMNLFVDHDNDGFWDSNEPAIDQARYRSHELNGNPSGSLSINALPTYQPVRIDTREIKFEDPFLVPRSRIYEVFTHAGSDVAIDVAVVLTGDIEGHVYSGETREPMRGVTVTLIDRNGFKFSETRSEFDGYYSFTGVPAGNYEIRVSSNDDDDAVDATRKVKLDGQVGYVTLDEIYL